MRKADELSAIMREAARRRELDRLMSLSVSRDGFPLAWRRALRFMLFVSLIDNCEGGDPGALPLLMAFLDRLRLLSLQGLAVERRAGDRDRPVEPAECEPTRRSESAAECPLGL